VALFKLTTIKSFAYRGTTEEWSNSYVFSGPNPADQAAWTAWGEKLKDLEKLIVPNLVKFERWYGYDEGSWETKPQHVDYQGTYAASTFGSASMTGAQLLPGDTAFWIRWDTGQYTSRGKRIYLRKYFHGALADSATTSDNLLPSQKTAATAFGAKLYDGASLIGTARLARETGTLPVAHLVGPYITTRTLKRRGKRKNPTP
jgi:hypothetical protein